MSWWPSRHIIVPLNRYPEPTFPFHTYAEWLSKRGKTQAVSWLTPSGDYEPQKPLSCSRQAEDEHAQLYLALRCMNKRKKGDSEVDFHAEMKFHLDTIRRLRCVYVQPYLTNAFEIEMIIANLETTAWNEENFDVYIRDKTIIAHYLRDARTALRLLEHSPLHPEDVFKPVLLELIELLKIVANMNENYKQSLSESIDPIKGETLLARALFWSNKIFVKSVSFLQRFFRTSVVTPPQWVIDYKSHLNEVKVLVNTALEPIEAPDLFDK